MPQTQQRHCHNNRTATPPSDKTNKPAEWISIGIKFSRTNKDQRESLILLIMLHVLLHFLHLAYPKEIWKHWWSYVSLPSPMFLSVFSSTHWKQNPAAWVCAWAHLRLKQSIPGCEATKWCCRWPPRDPWVWSATGWERGPTVGGKQKHMAVRGEKKKLRGDKDKKKKKSTKTNRTHHFSGLIPRSRDDEVLSSGLTPVHRVHLQNTQSQYSIRMTTPTVVFFCERVACVRVLPPACVLWPLSAERRDWPCPTAAGCHPQPRWPWHARWFHSRICRRGRHSTPSWHTHNTCIIISTHKHGDYIHKFIKGMKELKN